MDMNHRKRIDLWRSIFFLTIILIVSVSSCKAASVQNGTPRIETVRVVMDDDYPPFIFKDAEGNLKGILPDEWHLWMQKTGIRVTISAMDWAGAIQRMRSGDFDVIDTIFQNANREKIFDFTKSYVKIEVPVFFRSDISGIHGVDDLKGFVVAVKSGDNTINVLRSNGITHLLAFKNYKDIVEAARDHKVNVFVIDKPPAYYYLYKFGINDQFRETSPLYSGAFHRAVRKGNTRLLQAVENGFSRISQAEYQEIEKRWYGAPIMSPGTKRYLLIGSIVLATILLGLFVWVWSLRRLVSQRTASLEREIESRILKERLLQESEDRFRTLFDNSNEAIFIHEIPSGKIVDVNQTMCRMYGYTYEEVINSEDANQFGAGFPPYTHNDALTWIHKAMTGQSQMFEWLTKDKAGRLFWVEVTLRLLIIGDRERVIATIREINARKLAEEALQNSRAKLDAALASMADAVFISDADGNLIEFNEAYARFHRFETKEECIREKDQILKIVELSQEDGALVPFESWPVNRALRGETVTNAEYIICRLDSGETWAGSYSFGPIRDRQDAIIGSVIVARDVSEVKKNEEARKKLEIELKQVQKMEAIGQLAGGVAHDFNNMLAVIMGHVELAMHGIDAEHPLFGNLKEIQNAAKRSAEIIRQLLAFARKQTVIPQVINLNTTVAGMLKMLRRLIGEDITLIWTPGPDLWLVFIDPSQVDQILANLCVNARDAIPDRGTITVETQNCRINNEFCSEHADAVPGDYVTLAVRDTGTGISREALDHIFEPFYTTKGLGKGTGLGLATVYGAVKQNNGFVTIDSDAGNGTVFTVYFPKCTHPETTVEKEKILPPIEGNHETILLVEDEAATLNMASKMLEGLGYTVLAAGTPGDALMLARESTDPIHLLLSDVIMPEMNGKELAEEIIKIRPTIKCLFMSGHTADIITKRGLLNEGLSFIEKPFSNYKLASKIRSVLGDGDFYSL
jgi:PAS domain S-box-containing protein